MSHTHIAYSLAFAAALGAACSGAATSSNSDPNSPGDDRVAGDRVADDTVTDAGVPDVDAHVVADLNLGAGPAFDATYLGPCREAQLPVELLEGDMRAASGLGPLAHVTGPVTIDVQCMGLDIECFNAECGCDECRSELRVGDVVISEYQCSGNQCGVSCGVPQQGVVTVWGTLWNDTNGNRSMSNVVASCYVGADISPADARRDVPLDDGQCWSADDCAGPGINTPTMCSLTHSGIEHPQLDTCVSDADCADPGERCVRTMLGQQCTPPGECEACCKP